MNAERLAEYLEQGHSAFNGSAAALLRRQHEAIVKLRGALESCTKVLPQMYYAYRDAEQALKDTEGL